MQVDFSQIVPYGISILVVFLIYRRFRRNFGQLTLSPVRMRVRTILLLVIGCLLLPAALRSAAFMSAVLAGAAVGIALALWGAARTRFLRVSNQLCYVTHTYSGVVVTFLFMGRLIYRLVQVFSTMHATHTAVAADSANQAFAPASMLQSPVTLGLFFVLMGYYVCYNNMVLWKSKRVLAEEVSPASPLPVELEKRA